MSEFLRRLARTSSSALVEDAQLLERFAHGRDEAAFRALLERHGPLVWGLCRRWLPNAQDAEDAFQATFLVLASRAHAIRNGTALPSWLYGVAFRVASRVRKQAEQRQGFERPDVDSAMAPSRAERPLDEDEVHQLHAEVARLPARYRLPIVLHYFEGKSREEAAAQLGWTEGMVKGRLERARARLRARLAPAVFLALGPLAEPAPAALVRSTARLANLVPVAGALNAALTASVATLIEGTLRSMFVAKLRLVGGVMLAVAVLAAGVSLSGVRLPGTQAAQPAPKAPPTIPAPPLPRDVDVPSRQDGFLQFVGTEVKREDNVPADQLITVKRGGKEAKFRKLKVGDRVEAGQLVAGLDDQLARADVAVMEQKMRVAEAERDAAEATYKEAQQQSDIAERLHRQGRTAMSVEAVRTAALTAVKYRNDFLSKAASVELARLEREKAEKALHDYEVRSGVSGVITAIHRYPGEGVKRMEPILSVRPEAK